MCGYHRQSYGFIWSIQNINWSLQWQSIRTYPWQQLLWTLSMQKIIWVVIRNPLVVIYSIPSKGCNYFGHYSTLYLQNLSIYQRARFCKMLLCFQFDSLSEQQTTSVPMTFKYRRYLNFSFDNLQVWPLGCVYWDIYMFLYYQCGNTACKQHFLSQIENSIYIQFWGQSNGQMM